MGVATGQRSQTAIVKLPWFDGLCYSPVPGTDTATNVAKLGEPNPEKLQRIRTVFRDAFLDQVEEAYDIVDKPGADVLQVRASFVDLKINTTQGGMALRGDFEKACKGRQTYVPDGSAGFPHR